MVAVSIVSAMAVASLSINDFLKNSTSRGDRIQSTSSVASSLRERLKYTELCGLTIGLVGAQNVDAINVTDLLAGNQQLQVSMPGISAGINSDQSELFSGQVLPSQKILVRDLRFVNVRNISGDTYAGQVRISFDDISGTALAPFNLGTIIFNLAPGPNTGRSIASCDGASAAVDQQVCESMNCSWQTSPSPGCLCRTVSSSCPVGEYPVQFLSTGPVCQKLGDGPCPAGQYLTSIGLNSKTCAPLPVTTTTVTSTTLMTTTTLVTTTTVPSTTTTTLTMACLPANTNVSVSYISSPPNWNFIPASACTDACVATCGGSCDPALLGACVVGCVPVSVATYTNVVTCCSGVATDNGSGIVQCSGGPTTTTTLPNPMVPIADVVCDCAPGEVVTCAGPNISAMSLVASSFYPGNTSCAVPTAPCGAILTGANCPVSSCPFPTGLYYTGGAVPSTSCKCPAGNWNGTTCI